jgi:type I restriction enzyme, S subunit
VSQASQKNGWKTGKLKDLVFFQRGFDITQAQQREGPYPVISSSGVTSYHDEFRVRGPGVVIGRKGTLGSIHFAPRDYWPHDTTLWSKNLNGNNPKFAYYFLHTLNLERFDVGNSNPTLNRNHIHEMPVKIPPASVQDAIVEILSAYDELIENNRQRMVLLEDAARLLYQEWFVRLRFPGHDHTKIMDGIPNGWQRAKVGSLLYKFPRKEKIHRDAYEEVGTVPCVDQSAEFIGGFTYDVEARHIDPLPIIVFGDHTRVLKFVDFPFASGADGTQLIYPNREDLSPQFFYFALRALDLSNYFYARHFKFLKEEEILIPTDPSMREFTTFAANCFAQIQNLRLQEQKLRAARDLILPRLMSGEIEV